MRPGMLDPYSRVFAGWLTPVEIITDGFYPIQRTWLSSSCIASGLFLCSFDSCLPFSASEISQQVYVIRKKFLDGEYIYIENKQNYLWDESFEGSGIVMYHVDDNAPKQTERGYPGHSNWPQEHYRLHVLQADGKTDIESGINPGDAGDFWTSGMSLGPGGDWPNTDSISNGFQQTGITINVITDSSFVMVFQVTGLN